MGATKGKQKKSNEELVLAMELSVKQHQLKTQITVDAKETEKQNETQKKRFHINTSSSMLSLTGGGQFGNMGMIGRMASVYCFL